MNKLAGSYLLGIIRTTPQALLSELPLKQIYRKSLTQNGPRRTISDHGPDHARWVGPTLKENSLCIFQTLNHSLNVCDGIVWLTVGVGFDGDGHQNFESLFVGQNGRPQNCSNDTRFVSIVNNYCLGNFSKAPPSLIALLMHTVTVHFLEPFP